MAKGFENVAKRQVSEAPVTNMESVTGVCPSSNICICTFSGLDRYKRQRLPVEQVRLLPPKTISQSFLQNAHNVLHCNNNLLTR